MNTKLKNLINDNLKISLRQFAKETGITRQTIYNIMNNKHAPEFLTIAKICAYFNVDYREYL